MLQQRVGARPVLRLASDAGLRDLPNVPSLSLGTGEVTPLDLTAAFAMFPNGGFAVRPRGITRVVDADGGSAYDNPPHTERVLSPQTSYQMVSMLEDVIDRGTASAARNWGIRFPAGGKTGTTNDFKDAWFVGFSSSLVVGVWVGFDQPKTIAARRVWCTIRAADLDRLHAPGGAAAHAAGVRRSFRIARRADVPRLLSSAGRGLPGLHRALQGGRRRALTAVPGPQGQREAAGQAGVRGHAGRDRQ